LSCDEGIDERAFACARRTEEADWQWALAELAQAAKAQEFLIELLDAIRGDLRQERSGALAIPNRQPLRELYVLRHGSLSTAAAGACYRAARPQSQKRFKRRSIRSNGQPSTRVSLQWPCEGAQVRHQCGDAGRASVVHAGRLLRVAPV
jgi:hypothetical protein